MNEKVELNYSRSILMDRVQIVITPIYLVDDDERNRVKRDCFEALLPYFSKDAQDASKLIIRKFPNSRSKHVIFDGFLDNEKNDYLNYFSNVRMSVQYPFSITAEFNFIRYLRLFAMRDSSFQYEYDQSVCVNEDNYLNYHNYPGFDNSIVIELMNSMPNVFREFAINIWSIIFPDHSFKPRHYSVSHIEFNNEYFVGHGNSLNVMRKILQFMFTDKGRSFKNQLGSLGVNVYKADGNFDDVQNVIDTDQGQTIKFYMGKGIWFKIYRKTKDHVRVEVGFEKSFIERKCKTRGYFDVCSWLRKLAKETLHKANIPALISYVDTVSDEPDPLAQSLGWLFGDRSAPHDSYALIRSNEFLDHVHPGLSDVHSAVMSNTVVSDSFGVDFIRKNPGIRHLFTRSLKSDGSYGYLYDPLFIHRQNMLVGGSVPDPNEFLEHDTRMRELSFEKTFGSDNYPITHLSKDLHEITRSVSKHRLVSDKKKYASLVDQHHNDFDVS